MLDEEYNAQIEIMVTKLETDSRSRKSIKYEIKALQILLGRD
jgi:hypothetical protein